MVAEAFRSIDLPASELAVQPPNGRTLVNFETNFYTEQGRSPVRCGCSGSGWSCGSGRASSGGGSATGGRWRRAGPGAPYPHLEVTHDYLAKGGVRPSVDTTYAAQFRVNGGPWRDVDGTVTIPGEPVPLEVLTATPVLVGYR